MSEALKALLEKATKRPWRFQGSGPNGRAVYTTPCVIREDGYPVLLSEDDNEADLQLVAIAVNHLETATEIIELLARYRCECDGLAKLSNSLLCDSCVAKQFLAKIEAAAKGTP